MSKLAFITGITGQDGSYLAELLLEKDYKVYGIVRRTSLLYSNKRIDHIRKKITLKYGDMTDGAGLSNYIFNILSENNDFSVFEIYNLAAQSHVKISFELPEYTSVVDGIGTLKILEVIRSLPVEIQKKCKFYQAGTSEMYGDVLEKPQKETTPFNPQSPYACAKVYAHYIVKNYREGYGMFACNGILFNHESPRRGKNFVTMKIINCIKEIQECKREYMELGNIDSLRDWGHSKDYVRGMWLMLQQETPDDYVLATGKTTSVREFIEKCFEYIGDKISWEGTDLDEIGRDKNGVIRVKISPKYFRPCEVEYLLGDPSKAEKKLGWSREYDLERLINDIFEN
jgi:GDPmannose 4,6-dehydratase